MNLDFMKSFAQDLRCEGFATALQIRGCSKRQINKLEEYFDIQLPQIYKEFLSVMGRGAGTYNQGTDCFYDDLFDLREWLEGTLTEDHSPFHLTKDAFVFSSHQGYIYHFFYTIDNQIDPAVWGYREGDMLPKKINDSFSDFLLTGLNELKVIRDSHLLLVQFNNNRKTNPKVAYQAGKEFLERHSYIKGTAQSIAEWIARYEEGSNAK